MRLILLKSQKFANQAGYYLLNGRWHSIKQGKAAPKGAPVSSHPHAAGKPVQKETLAEHEWAHLKLPAENVNAGTFNKQLDQLKAAAAAGDVTGILGSGYGTNTYGKKLAIIANHVLELLGSDHKVTPGQKAGTHAAVQTAPEIEAEKPAPEPETKPDAELAVPDFAEGKQAKGVKAHYEKVAKKIILAAKVGDLAALQFMPTDKGQTWKAKTANSKKLLELHQAAIVHAQAQKGQGKNVQHPDAEKQAAQEAQDLAKEQGTPEKKPEPKPAKAEEPKFTDKGTLAKPSGYGKTFANLKQANAAAEKLKAQGHDVYVTATHPYQVKLNKPDPKQESKPESAKPAKIEPMKNYGWNAVELANAYSIDQLESMLKQVEEEHANPKGDNGGYTENGKPTLNLLDKQGMKKHDALTWAITHKAKAEKKAAQDKPKAEDQGPKEGDTKQGADGTLVFKNGRWHKQGETPKAEQKPAAEEQPKGDAASKLAQIPWDSLLLPDSNKNAKSHNKQVAKIKALAEAGDIEGLKNFKAGVNTYGKKQNLLAQTALAALEESPPAPTLDGMPQKPTSGDAHLLTEIEDAMMDAEDQKLASLITKTSGSAANYTAHQYAKAAYQFVMGKDYVSQGNGDAPAADGKPQKPTGLTSVGWNSIVNDIEDKMAAKDAFLILQHAKQTEGLTSPEAKQVHDYASAAYEYLFTQAEKDFPKDDESTSTENDGPQDGETKEGANGMLVFQNGRWHKVGDEKSAEKPAAKTPADVEIPDFSVGKNPNHSEWFAQAAKALKEKVAAEGKAGFKGVLTNHKTGAVSVKCGGVTISKASVASANVNMAKFAQFVDELKVAASAMPKTKTGPKPTQTASAASGAPKSIESMDHWKQTGPQGGSNPGGKFQDEHGVEWYCKFPESEDVAKSEVLAAKLYAAAGVAGQDAKLITKDGKVGIASRWQAVAKAAPKDLAKTPGVLAGFATDAWLANWDVVGLAYDNLQVDQNGQAMRVDAGGSLMYRAQGGKKAFGDAVTELDSLRDKKLNPQAAAVFGKITKADIAASVAKVAQISDAQIRLLVDANGPGTKEERKALADTLIARKNDLIAKYPKALKPTKKRLDPTKLPVKEERLPKAHDFANWNGPGSGLSGAAHVNEANAQVEQQMLDLAKTGNLTKLKDFKFQPMDKATGKPSGDPKPIAEHPSKHVTQFHADLVQVLDEIANPPQPLKIFQESDVDTVEQLNIAFPPKKFGTTVASVHSNEKLGFWVVLGGVHGVEKFKPKKVANFTQQAIEAAYAKYKKGAKLARHFIDSVQESGSYNDLFRDGKEKDGAGNKLADVAKAALEFATEQPEGTSVYRWQNMPSDMVKKIMAAPEGSVFQATGPMCTSYSPTATSHFGKHRVTIRYAKGAKAVESFGSGGFASEKEITTLPNSRFVILKREMVPSGSGGGERLELEVLMLPPDLGL